MTTPLDSVQRYFDLIDYVLTHSQRNGATAAEVSIAVDKGLSVTARQCAAETIEYHHDHELQLSLYQGDSSGTVILSDMRHSTIDIAIDRALRIARFTEPDPLGRIAEKELLATEIPLLAINYPWDITPAAAMELAIQGEQAGFAVDPRITHSEGTVVNCNASYYAYGNTNGFLRGYASTLHSMSTSMIARQADEMQAQSHSFAVRDAADFPGIASITQKAAQKALERLDARILKTQMAPVLFSAETARGLLGHFLNAIRGHNLYMKSSFLQDALGQKLFPDNFSIQEFPHLGKGIASSPFDKGGLPTREKYFVKDGIIENYMLGLYAARKLQMAPTGNGGGSHNLIVSQGAYDLPQLFKCMGTGLYVTDVMGGGVNLVTGDYSRAASGFWIENGERTYAVDGITIAGNLRDIYANIIAVGNDAETQYRIRAPSLLVGKMMIGGK